MGDKPRRRQKEAASADSRRPAKLLAGASRSSVSAGKGGDEKPARSNQSSKSAKSPDATERAPNPVASRSTRTRQDRQAKQSRQATDSAAAPNAPDSSGSPGTSGRRKTGTPLTSLRNVGPAFSRTLAGVGIEFAEDLRELGADAAYERLLRAGSRPHFIGYYVIEMALQGRPWNDCRGQEKIELRRRFDAIKARVSKAEPHDGLERARLDAALDRIGVIKPGR